MVDTISQIRKLYPEGATHRIFLYCLVTAEHVLADVGFFYANQYAALTELNALRLGAWRPHDVLAFTEKRLESLRNNFQSCFLISPINERGEVASKEEQQDMIAAYIYQKTVALQGITPPSLHKAESFEDLKAHRCHSQGPMHHFRLLRNQAIPHSRGRNSREALLLFFNTGRAAKLVQQLVRTRLC